MIFLCAPSFTRERERERLMTFYGNIDSKNDFVMINEFKQTN